MALTKKQQLDALLQAALDSYHADRVDQAIYQLAKNARNFPKAAKLFGYLGFLYTEAGEYAKSAQAFRKAKSLSLSRNKLPSACSTASGTQAKPTLLSTKCGAL
jgi:uncharacterized protein HemY